MERSRIDRQDELEGGGPSGRLVQPEPAAVQFRDLARDGQPEAGASSTMTIGARARLVGAEESIEDEGTGGRRNAGTGVGPVVAPARPIVA